jgi:tRNA G37 N-methylase Trm5
LTFITGLDNKETIYRENKTLFKLDAEKCYFSPRSNNERLRISRLVKKNESVLVMFSGIGAFNFVILKNSFPKEVYGVEANKTAHKYALENAKLNKIPENKFKLFNGDVKKVLPKINKKFDRILMPLPKESERFFELALKKIKKNGVVHFYTFLEEPKDEIGESKLDKYWKEIIRDRIKRYVTSFRILRIVKCGIYGPKIFRICADIKILK